jgi:chromosome segregation ATPase
MRMLRSKIVCALAMVLASGAATGAAAQDAAGERACAQLLPAIDHLEAALAQDAKARTVDNDTQRMQLVVTLLGLRYRNIEALESSLRTAETEENDIRGATARGQAQLEALDEAARNSSGSTPDAERKAQRAEIDANMKGLEERAKGLRERKANVQGQLALERHDIEKLESVVRGWIEKTP